MGRVKGYQYGRILPYVKAGINAISSSSTGRKYTQKLINGYLKSNKKNSGGLSVSVRPNGGSARTRKLKIKQKTNAIFHPAKAIGGHQYVGGYTWRRRKYRRNTFSKMDPPIYYSEQEGILKESDGGKQCLLQYALMGHKDMYRAVVQWSGTSTDFSADRDRKYWISYFKQGINMVNASNSMTEVKVYSIWARQSLNSVNNDAYNTPIGMWDQGEVDSAGLSLASQIPHNNPMQSAKFRRNFKISRCVTRTLAPGEELKFKTKLYYNKFMSGYDAFQMNTISDSEDGSVRGWTHWVLITATGQPSLCTTTVPEGKHISTAPVCLHVITKKEIRGKYKLDKMEPIVHRANALVTGGTAKILDVTEGDVEIVDVLNASD